MSFFKKSALTDVITHYDALVDEGNDPVCDSEALREYMDGWDGRRFIEALTLSEHDSVLEIGVGTGRLAVRTAPMCKNFIGIDISPKTVRLAKQHLSSFENAEIICADFMSWQTEQTFSLIYSSLTFMHFEDKQGAVLKSSGLLKDGGRLVISIDKNDSCYIDTGIRRIKVYPDTPENINNCMKNSGLHVTKVCELPFAYMLTAAKPSGLYISTTAGTMSHG